MREKFVVLICLLILAGFATADAANTPDAAKKIEASAQAAKKTTKAEKSTVSEPDQLTAMEELIARIMNALDTSKTHCQGYFHLHGQAGPIVAGERTVDVTLPYLDAKCMLLFAEDVELPLVRRTEDMNPSVKKILPKLLLGLKGLRVIPQVLFDSRSKQAKQYVKLEVCAAIEKGECVRKPIRVSILNEKAAGLIDIGLYGMTLYLKQGQTLSGRKDFEGTCDSEQEVLDFTTLKNSVVKPTCLIKGYWDPKNTEKPFEYDIQYLATETLK